MKKSTEQTRFVFDILRITGFVYPALILVVGRVVYTERPVDYLRVDKWLPSGDYGEMSVVVFPMYLMAVLFFVAGVYLPKFFLRGEGDISTHVSRTDEKNSSNTQSKKFISFVLQLVLFENVANMGFALGVLISQFEVIVPFVAFAWLGVGFLTRPQESKPL